MLTGDTTGYSPVGPVVPVPTRPGGCERVVLTGGTPTYGTGSE